MPQIKLQSSDSQIFEVDIEVAVCSRKIRAVLEDLDIDDEQKKFFRIPNVRSDTLKKILEWATYHKDDPPVSRLVLPDMVPYAGTLPLLISPWDEEFLNINLNTLFEIIIAAFHLDILALAILCSKKLLNLMHEKRAKEVRDVSDM